MSKTIILIPTATSVGLTSISLGIVNVIGEKGHSIGFMKPVTQPTSDLDNDIDRSTKIIANESNISTVPSLTIGEAEKYISNGEMDVLLEKIVENYKKFDDNRDFIIVEGLIPNKKNPYVALLNYQLAKTLDAQIILVATQGHYLDAIKLKEHIEALAMDYGGKNNPNILGVILNKFNAPSDFEDRSRPDVAELFGSSTVKKLDIATVEQTFSDSSIKLLASVPWKSELISMRTVDVVKHMNAIVLNEGEINTRRINNITFCSRSINNMTNHFKANSLLVTSGDRPDVIVAASLAAMNGTKFGGLLLTGGYDIDPKILDLCKIAFNTGLPVFKVESDTWQTALYLHSLSLEVPSDDKERINAIKLFTSEHLNKAWIKDLIASSLRSHRMSPPAFRYQLTELAKKANKTVVLPEGDEPRTIKAAILCAERNISKCILLGDPKEVNRVAEAEGVKLCKGVVVINPDDIREQYVPRLVELRKSKGLTESAAREQLEDNVVLGTMMLEANEVDGLVSGAVHTTANTIRPPLQIIKTAENSSLVSSIFFMLLPEEVFVYGDCAINPNPNAEQLAEIAIQSADSAKAFGVEPRVAMISYSTGTSGAGVDVEKVRTATEIVKQKRPDILIDGPLQYDAAVMEDVAKTKAPNSPVAGKATVFIFPDLNTGNTTYKAVQRSADLISIGPMLQGMRKPVNDLSRGALVDDIVYTIALTAIQSTQN